MTESGLLIDLLRAFSHRRFIVLDPKVRKEGIATILKTYHTARDNGVVWRSNSGAIRIGRRFVQFGIAGLPDICGFSKHGHFIGCEAKIGAAKLSIAQEPFHEAAHVSNGIVFVARSYDECIAALIHHGY